jgi:GGDEF domain-containing protein
MIDRKSAVAIDPLTGLPNHTLLHDRIIHAGQLARRTETPVSLILLDLNQFDDVNEC